MKLIGATTTKVDTYSLYKYGDDDYVIAADNGDWSTRGNFEDIEEELDNLDLSFSDFL